MKKIITILICLLLLVSCSNDGNKTNTDDGGTDNAPAQEGSGGNEGNPEGKGNDGKDTEDTIGEPQEALVTPDNDQILTDFLKLSYKAENKEYEITKVFATYANTTIVEIKEKDKQLVSTSFIPYGFDNVCMVIPGGYETGSYYVLAYNDGEFKVLNKAYEELKWLTKADCYDLKHKFDEYYYNGNPWYENIVYKYCSGVDEVTTPPSYTFEYYYINNGIFEQKTTNQKVISYKLTQEEYETLMNTFYTEYDITTSTYSIDSYYGDINGAKVFFMDFPISAAYARFGDYQIGNYIFKKDANHCDYYAYINGELYRLEDAYKQGLISDETLRIVAFSMYLEKNPYNFGRMNFYINYSLTEITE